MGWSLLDCWYSNKAPPNLKGSPFLREWNYLDSSYTDPSKPDCSDFPQKQELNRSTDYRTNQDRLVWRAD
ncbi:hypothetical protein Pyn_24534 [Prunus yedoensis var. nudiflora]|uniref:Uncharacterized protein n=1 Tax=Prunus yedoensis var. nudiflora TaxID=2094558 RepID=A0A314UUF0_PRUYE|nr:hypothetical protein Pyn_24534 [Prunus yedoensis var. nudiflora]